MIRITIIILLLLYIILYNLAEQIIYYTNVRKELILIGQNNIPILNRINWNNNQNIVKSEQKLNYSAVCQIRDFVSSAANSACCSAAISGKLKRNSHGLRNNLGLVTSLSTFKMVKTALDLTCLRAKRSPEMPLKIHKEGSLGLESYKEKPQRAEFDCFEKRTARI